ncbi:MAG: hypothetical protein RIT27_1714 [Pseudomonadota bacterium]|jgi:hypothetical protein
MYKETWIFIIITTILILMLGTITYLFVTTNLAHQMQQMLQDTLKTSENNQFDGGKVYPYFLLLAITGLIYALTVAAWHYWKLYQEKRSQCATCQRQRQPTFVHIHYVCHCNKNGDGVGYCYPLFQEGKALQVPPQSTNTVVSFFKKKPSTSSPPVPTKDNLLGNI